MNSLRASWSCPLDLRPARPLPQVVLFRHGAMLVGPTGGGKSAALEATLSARAELPGRLNGGKVSTHLCYPKALTGHELYGGFEGSSHEWTEGLVGVVFRRAIKVGPAFITAGPVFIKVGSAFISYGASRTCAKVASVCVLLIISPTPCHLKGVAGGCDDGTVCGGSEPSRRASSIAALSSSGASNRGAAE